MKTQHIHERLQAFALAKQITLEHLPQADSTNDLATDPRYADGDVILAEEQLAGRGQRGNTWSSSPGENLTFTLVLLPEQLRIEEQFYLSKAVALGVCDTLEGLGLRPSIKWPNDIYLGDKKVAGILIENDLMGALIFRSIAGIGLNVNQLVFDPSLPNPTSLALASGERIDRGALFETLYDKLMARYRRLTAPLTVGLTPEHPTAPREAFETAKKRIDRDYLSRLYRLGEEHLFRDGTTQHIFAGTIFGVEPSGELRIRHAKDGVLRGYLFKEIEYVL